MGRLDSSMQALALCEGSRMLPNLQPKWSQVKLYTASTHHQGLHSARKLGAAVTSKLEQQHTAVFARPLSAAGGCNSDSSLGEQRKA